MRLGVDLAPLPDDLEVIRQRIAALPKARRRLLFSWLHRDRSQANDRRHLANAERFERERAKRDRLARKVAKHGRG